MADPFSKYLNVEEKNTLKGNNNPFSKYLNPSERTSSDFKLSNEDPPVDYTKPYEMPGEKDPFAKYLDKGYFNTGTQEDIDLGRKISNAFSLGFKDTVRGLRQMSTANEDVLDKLRSEQKELYKDFDGPGGYLVAAAYFGGAILDPAGWLLPVTKARTLYKMAKYGAVNAGIAGALGYVDEESILDSRAKQAAASAVGGAILSPVIGAGVKKIKGEKIELGIPGYKDKTDIDISLKSAASNNLHKQQLFNEAGLNKRDVINRDKIDIQENELIKDTPSNRKEMLRGVRLFYKQFTDMWEERVGRPLYRQISKDEQVTIPGTRIPIKGLTGAELGTGLAGGIYGYQTAEDDAPITTKLGRMGIGFLAGAGGIKATKKVGQTKTFTRKFGEGQEDEVVEITESVHELLGRWFIDNYKMPANYKALQASAQGHAAHIASRFSDIAIKIQKNLTEDESKILFNMLEGDNIFEVQSAAINNIAKDARKLITEIGQEYVDMGILNPATFADNKASYLKRTYSKYKDEPREFGEELRLRGAYQKVTKQEYEDYYKDQIAFTTTSLVEKPIKELEDVPGAKGKLKYLFEDVAGKKERLKGHKGWELLNTSEAQYAKLGPGDEVEIRWQFTKPQRVGLGEIEDASFAIAETGRAFSSTLPQLKFYDKLAKEPYTYTKGQYAELPQELKDTLVKMPTTKIDPNNPKSRFRYGNLADKYVPEEVYKDLLSTTRHYNTMGSGFWGKYKKLNSVWKVSKTAWNPTVHTNNIVSNFILHDLIDADFKYLPKAFKALMAHNKDGKVSEVVRLAEKSGVFEADFVTKELGKLQELAIAMPYKYDGNAWNSGVTAAGKIFEDIRKNNPLAKLTDWYRLEDHIFRLSVFQDRLAKGYTAAEAGLDARRAFIDYNINAPAINWMRQTATPFLAYTYRIVPLLAETAVVRPWKYLKYAALGYGLNSMGEIVGGGDEKAERALMQEKQKGKFIFDFMPYREIKMPIPKFGDQPFEGPKYMNFTRFVPGGDIFDVGGNLFPYLPAPVQPNFGLMGEVLSSMLGFDLYGQRKLRGLGINDWEDLKVKGGDLIQDLTPNIPFFPGSYSTQRIDSARKGKESPYRAKETELEALFRSVGFKIETKSIDKLKTLKAAELNRKIKPIRENIRDLNNDLYKGLIDKEQYKKKLQYQKNLLKKIVGKYRTAFSIYEEKNYKQPIRIDEFTPLNIKEQTQKLFDKN